MAISLKMEIKLLITNIFITNLDSHCRVFNNISRQRYLSTRTEDTSNLGDCRGQTEAKTSSKIRFVFITKRDSPPTLTYLLSLFPGCNCYLTRSQGSEEIIDESKKVQIDGNTVSHNATMIQHLTISKDGGVTGLVGQRHLVERFCDGEGADQVHPRRHDHGAEVLPVEQGGLFVKELVERDKPSWRLDSTTTARRHSEH